MHRCEHPPLRLRSRGQPFTNGSLIVWCGICGYVAGPAVVYGLYYDADADTFQVPPFTPEHGQQA